MARPQAPVGAPREPVGTPGHRERLEAVRDLLEARLPDASDRDLAALTARYQAVLTELAGLPDTKASDGIDDLAAARRARRANAAGS